MLHSPLSRAAGALALFAACGTASAATVALPTGVTVTLDGWQSGWLVVSGTNGRTGFEESAGGFAGSLTGAGAFSTDSLLTYCVELTESIGFDRAIGGYSIVGGLDYFSEASTVDMLGRLMTYAARNPGAVDDAFGSAAMQIAVWNTVYDDDQRLGKGSFQLDLKVKKQPTLIGEANAMLESAAAMTSQFDVYVLKKAGSQDLLLTVPMADGGSPPSAVPEPGSAALGLLALGALGAGLRRRRG